MHAYKPLITERVSVELITELINPDKECKDVGLQEEIHENGGLMIHSCDWQKTRTISWKVFECQRKHDCHLLTLTSATSL